MKVVKIITQHKDSNGLLESPDYFELPSAVAVEMAKFKNYYHYLNFRNLLNEDDVVRVFNNDTKPDYILDFREQYKNIDIEKIYEPMVLQEYINETSNEYDKYGNSI